MSLKDNLLNVLPIDINSKSENDTFKEIRKQALDNFKKLGFPTRKEEAWKYTSLNSILREEYQLEISEPKIDIEKIKSYFLPEADTYKVIFVNGILQENLSTLVNTEGFVIDTLAKAKDTGVHKEIIAKHYNQIAKKESMAELNTAMNFDGLFVYINKSIIVDKPIELFNFAIGTNNALLLQPRNLIVAEDNAQVQIIERHQNIGESSVFTNSVTEVYNSKDAQVKLYKIQANTETSSLVDGTYILQEGNTESSVHTFSFGGKITRNNLEFYQHGSHSNSILKGITILEDKEHVDHHTLVHHTQPDCESHQDYKGIYADRSTGIFNGKIFVDKIAQKLNAYQQNNNIVVDDRATINAKPQLEIFADDVRCSHGCTIGQLPEESLFYLRSRGIPKKEAEAVMMYAFANTALESVSIPSLRKEIGRLIAEKLNVGIDIEI